MPSVEPKQLAHELIERIPAGRVPAAVAMLEKMLDPASTALVNVPVEDEAISEEEEQSVARAKLETGVPSEASHWAFLSEFGLTKDDWERLGETPLEPPGEGH